MLSNLIKNIFSGRSGNSALPSESRAPHVYLVGYPGLFFKMFAPPIAHAPGSNVRGIISDRFAIDHPAIKLWGQEFPLVGLPQLESIAKRQPVEVIHFFEDLDQCWALSTIAGLENVTVYDFLSKLDRLNLPHTYQLVKDERSWWEQRSPEQLDAIAKQFSDDRSKLTLNARIRSILTGSRFALMEASFGGEYEYFNRHTPQASLIPGDHETYVDVGAAHGDTVDRFTNLTGGRFEKIHAFEPTPGQFAQLATRATDDGRIKAHRLALGDSPGQITFYDNAANPLGGNALAGEGSGSPIQVECARLDDVVESCSLIKMDVEGYECRVLRGAKDLIRRSKPNMAITCYHYPQDMTEILETVRDIHAYRHVALRHYGPSLYDSILLFSDTQAFA